MLNAISITISYCHSSLSLKRNIASVMRFSALYTAAAMKRLSEFQVQSLIAQFSIDVHFAIDLIFYSAPEYCRGNTGVTWVDGFFSIIFGIADTFWKHWLRSYAVSTPWFHGF
jgi:hypothetical protein